MKKGLRDTVVTAEWTFNLFGDPSMPIWLSIPAGLDVDHPGSIDRGPQIFTVMVGEGDLPLEGATVCLMKEGEVYEVESTSAEGEATFSITPSSPGEMFVTVTRPGYFPYEGSCRVRPPHARTSLEE